MIAIYNENIVAGTTQQPMVAEELETALGYGKSGKNAQEGQGGTTLAHAMIMRLTIGRTV